MAGVMVVLGTRPEAIKLIPVIAALRRRGVPVSLCVTAQHRDLLDQALSSVEIVPDFDLDIMAPGQPLGVLTGRMLVALDHLFEREQPARVIVQGDTATALAGAQAAFFRGIPVAHVEAGLRTGDLAQPWPEEGNRRAIATWADLHFAPTARAVDALLNEGVAERCVHVTGNTIVDALTAERARACAIEPIVQALLDRCGDRRLILVTCHRRENLGVGVEGVIGAVRLIAERADTFVVAVAHPNPLTRDPLTAALGTLDNAALIGPLAFGPFLQLLAAAYLAITDSGGVQEEAPALGTPLLVTRGATERPEGVEAGTALLVGTDAKRIVGEASRILDNPLLHARMARVHQPYGDGRAAERIAGIIAAEQGAERLRASGE